MRFKVTDIKRYKSDFTGPGVSVIGATGEAPGQLLNVIARMLDPEHTPRVTMRIVVAPAGT